MNITFLSKSENAKSQTAKQKIKNAKLKIAISNFHFSIFIFNLKDQMLHVCVYILTNVRLDVPV